MLLWGRQFSSPLHGPYLEVPKKQLHLVFPFFFFFLFFLIFLITKEKEEDKNWRTKQKKNQQQSTNCSGQSKFLCLQFSVVTSCRTWIAGYLAVHRNQMMRCLNFITVSTVNCALTVVLSPNCRHRMRDCLQSYSKKCSQTKLVKNIFVWGSW